MKLSKNISCRTLAGETFILNRSTSAIHSFNETGNWIWAKLKDGWDSEKIAEALCEEYDVTKDQALADIQNLMISLSEKDVFDGIQTNES